MESLAFWFGIRVVFQQSERLVRVSLKRDGLNVVGAEKSSVREDDEGSDDSEDGLPPLEKNLNHLTLQQDSDEESE